MPSQRLLLTGFGPGERSEANKQIRALGGKFINANEYRADCTHIVCKNPSRSEKFLSGCLEGKWILTPAYLRDSVQNGAWLPEEAYEWSDSTPHVGSPLPLPNLLNAPKRCRMRVKNRLKLFRDWRVLFLVDDPVRKKVYSKLIECGGGQVVKTVAITRQGVRFTGLVTHAFYDTTYEHLASDLKKSGVACYEPVFIGDCILKDNSVKKEEKQLVRVDSTLTGKKRPLRFSSNIIESSKRPKVLAKGQKTKFPNEPEDVSMTTPPPPVKRLKDRKNVADKQESHPVQNAAAQPPPPVRLSERQKSKRKKVLLAKEMPVEPVAEEPVREQSSVELVEDEAIPWLPAFPSTSYRLPRSANSCEMNYVEEDILYAYLDAEEYVRAYHYFTEEISACVYPTPRALYGIMSSMMKGSELEAVKGLGALNHLTVYHSPVQADMRSIYLQAMKYNHDNQWEFLLSVMKNAGQSSDEPLSRTSKILLEFLVVEVLQIDFMESESEKKMIEYIIFPKLDAKVNRACRELFDCLETCHNSAMYLVQSITALVAESLRSFKGHVSFLSAADVFAKELSYHITDALKGKKLQSFLRGIQSPWLAVKVSEHLLDLMNDSLVESHHHSQTLNLHKIRLKYMKLIPLKFLPRTPKKKSSPKIISMSPAKPSPSKPVVIKPPVTKPVKCNKRNRKGESPLHVACIKNHISEVKHLLAIPGVQVNAKDNAGWTPLHEACNHGHLECIRELLKFKPHKLISNYFGKGDHKEPAGIDLMACNDEGITPLHDAVLNDRLEAAELLLSRGGVGLLSAKTNQDDTPIDLVQSEAMLEKLTSYSEGKSGVKTALSSCSEAVMGSNIASMDECSAYSFLVYVLVSSYLRCKRPSPHSVQQMRDHVELFQKHLQNISGLDDVSKLMFPFHVLFG